MGRNIDGAQELTGFSKTNGARAGLGIMQKIVGGRVPQVPILLATSMAISTYSIDLTFGHKTGQAIYYT